MFTTVKSGAEMVALLAQADELVTAALAGVQFALLDDDAALSVLGALEAVGRRVDGGRIGLPGAGIAFSADLIRAQAHEWEAALDPDGAAPTDDEHAATSTVGFGLLRNGLYPLRGGVTPDLLGVMNGVFATFLSAHAAPAFPSAEEQARMEAGELVPGSEAAAVDDRSGGEKRADILRAVFEATARDPKTPNMGGAAPVVMVHVNARDLKSGRGVGWIDGVDAPVSLGTVHQRLCSGGYQQVVVGDDGHVLHLGVKERFFSPAQRRAIAARDGGCIGLDKLDPSRSKEPPPGARCTT